MLIFVMGACERDIRNSFITPQSFKLSAYNVGSLITIMFWSHMHVLCQTKITMLHWFIITGHGLYCFTSCLTGSSLLIMVCIASFHASLVHHDWAWSLFFQFTLHWFICTGHGLHCFINHAQNHWIRKWNNLNQRRMK